MRQVSITIGLPVYNAMPYLRQAIEGLLAQSFGDFEILAVVDGASDGSLEYLRSVRDQRLHIVEQSNAGVAATLNRILNQTRTAWLIRQDADDVSRPDRIARTMQEIAAHPDAGMIYSLAEYESGLGQFRSTCGTHEERRRLVESGHLLSICHSTVALNVRKTMALGGYRTGLHAEDADLWWRMTLAHETCCIPEVLVAFRQSASSVSTRNFAKQELQGLYVQYLLLSHLRKWEPSSWEDSAPLLAQLAAPASLRAKQHLRAFNMQLAESQMPSAVLSLLRSAAASPVYLARRLKDEIFRNATIANGLPPGVFFARKEWLWPRHFHTSAPLQEGQERTAKAESAA